MFRSPESHIKLGVVLFALLAAGVANANAQEAMLARGDAVVTGYSGVKPLDTPVPNGANPLDYFVIDLNGPSAEILSLSSLGDGPHGQLVPAPVKRQITAGEVGQVFAVAIDDGLGQAVPNVYLGATSAYGIQIVGPDKNGNPIRLKKGEPGAQFMAGQFGPAPNGTPGTIWRVDGATGAVSPFAALPGNSGPGVGGIVFDAHHKEFFASDLDNGLIYRISAEGQVLHSFDHGVNGRPAKGLPPVADDGATMNITSPSFNSEDPGTWGYTPKDRMVWGMAVHDGRLYYAVAGGKQVWSIGIRNDGDFAGDPRWELDANALPGDGPITDMLFDNRGRMLLAQRGAPRGSYDFSVFAEPGKSSVVRYSLETPDDPATPSVWRQDADEYAIGMRPEYRFADGGIALGYAHDPETGALKPGSCGATLWSTGSRLRSSLNPDAVDDGTGEADVHGLQGNDESLVRPQKVPPAQSYFIDYDGLFGDAANSGHIGDVVIWQPCDQQGFEELGNFPPGYSPPGTIPPGFPPEFPPPHYRGHTNLKLTKHARGRCVPRGAGWACGFDISIQNTGPDNYFGSLLIADHLPGSPSGALMGFGPHPPWSCWLVGPSSYKCWRPATFLPPGASQHLFAVVWLPNATVRHDRCQLRNVAHIDWAPGGTQWNTNPADDTDGASVSIPSRECQPERTNLVIRKVSEGCKTAGRGAACDYRVTVINAGPGTYHDTIKVFDQPLAGTTATFAGAPWSCPSSGGGYECTYPVATLAAGGAVSFQTTVNVPAAVARQNNCNIPNTAHIVYAPGGSPENFNPADDTSTATGVVPNLCVPPPQPIIQQQCPPGYQFVDGGCRRGGVLPPPERRCPEGTVGEWPNCHVVAPPPPCPEGTVRHGDRCVPVERVCPRGTVGVWPNCHRVLPPPQPCPEGTVRRGDRCVPVVHACPPGTIGRWPHCRPIVRRCPPGMIGTWPRCRRIDRPTEPSRHLNHRPQIERPLPGIPRTQKLHIQPSVLR